MSLTEAQRAFITAGIMLLFTTTAGALESDRQQPIEVNADTTDGMLGDGITTLRGNVEIRQGSLHIRADEAEVEKAEGKVRKLTLRGKPAYLEQEIEQEGQVRAQANVIEYSVGLGIVTFTGAADVQHPQYQISGENLRYDLNAQHFEGDSGANGDGRIRIQLDPEMAPVDEQDPQPESEDSGV